MRGTEKQWSQYNRLYHKTLQTRNLLYMFGVGDGCRLSLDLYAFHRATYGCFILISRQPKVFSIVCLTGHLTLSRSGKIMYLQWQKTSPGCTIMNQRVRDNRCSGSTPRLRPTKNSRHRLPLGKSCWPSFGMSMALYWYLFRKRVKLRIVLDTVTC